jgi:hypothetical protein
MTPACAELYYVLATQLSQRASAALPTGVEEQALFCNGYVITCLVETTTTKTICVEGT